MSNQEAMPSQSQQHQQAQGQPQWYRVFKPQRDTAAHDPLDPAKRYHEGIFVEANPENRQGTVFHVTGDILAASGMRYEERPNYKPEEDSVHLHSLPQIGWVLAADFHSGRISTILRALPTPTKQQGINFWETDPVTGRHEIIWTKENGDRYEPGEQRRPIFKCNEWTNLYAIPALRDAGVLRDDVA
ncbi:hypothetical protein PRK78_005513 [Emydomyces testavorans]|uniref:Uncharacterized protein n=1 Tax=Emydomyces testavorans TaxID=2070801 RepID=A0AAF0DJS7_9EURO|nr:hypothetical protein PRK78_005513 [Emydomyces testavorans]